MNEVPRNGPRNAWFNLAKRGDEEISLKEHVERMMEGQNDADNMENRAVSSALRGSGGPEERG